MDNENREQFGSVETTHRLWLFFNDQTKLLKEAHSAVLGKTDEIWNTITPLLFSALDSCDSITLLSQNGKMRDCFILARTIFETVINTCFICAKGTDAAKRAKRHALQKSFRDLNRDLEINQNKLTLKWTGEVELVSNPELRAALAEFTSRKGREITSWTPATVKEQIEEIDTKYGHNISSGLQFGLVALYRHGSEIAHGTLFGALFSLGLTSPSRSETPEKLQSYQRQNLSMVLMMLGLSISSLIGILAKEAGLQGLHEKSKQETQELKKEPWVADGPA